MLGGLALGAAVLPPYYDYPPPYYYPLRRHRPTRRATTTPKFNSRSSIRPATRRIVTRLTAAWRGNEEPVPGGTVVAVARVSGHRGPSKRPCDGQGGAAWRSIFRPRLGRVARPVAVHYIRRAHDEHCHHALPLQASAAKPEGGGDRPREKPPPRRELNQRARAGPLFVPDLAQAILSASGLEVSEAIRDALQKQIEEARQALR